MEGIGNPSGDNILVIPAKRGNYCQSSTGYEGPVCCAGDKGMALAFVRKDNETGNYHRCGNNHWGEHWPHPRHRDEEKEIPRHDTRRPVNQKLKPNVVENVPDPEGYHEIGPGLTAILSGHDPNRGQHHQSSGLPAQLYEKTPPMLFTQRSNLLGCKDGECEPTGGWRVVDGPKVLHHCGLDERERDCPQNDCGYQSHRIPLRLGT